MGWRREDGSHFDPWIRVHERVGGEIVAAAPESMLIEAPVADWEEWTEFRLPGRRLVRPPGDARDARGARRCRQARRAERLDAPPAVALAGQARRPLAQDDEAVAGE